MKTPRRMLSVRDSVYRWHWLLTLTFAMGIPGEASAGAVIQAVSVPAASVRHTEAAHGSSGAASFSADGRKLVFVSDAPDLVLLPHRGGWQNVYVQDLATRAITLVSVAADGNSGGNGGSTDPVISADGRYVAFVSDASNLVPGDLNGVSDVFLRDLERGETRLISRQPGGPEADRESFSPAISSDGQLVTFQSLATPLTTTRFGPSIGVFQADWKAGKIGRLDARADGSGLVAYSAVPFEASSSGQLVAFIGVGTYSDFPPATNGIPTDVFLYRSGRGEAERVFLPPSATGDQKVAWATGCQLSGNGQILVFRERWGVSEFTERVWRMDLRNGSLIQVTDSMPTGDDPYESEPSRGISDDGQIMSVRMLRPRLGTTDLEPYVLLWKLGRGLVSMQDLVLQGAALPDPLTADSPILSPDGRKLAYVSAEAHPSAGVSLGGVPRLFLRDLESGATRLISASIPPAGSIPFLEFSPDSKRVVVTGESPQPTELSADESSNLYLGEVDSPTWESLTRGNAEGSSVADRGASISEETGGLSDEGRRVLFRSTSDDLVPGDNNRSMDVFVRDVVEGRTRMVGVPIGMPPLPNGVQTAILSGDGNSVAFLSRGTNFQTGNLPRTNQVLVHDLKRDSIVLASAVDGQEAGGKGTASRPAVNRDGTRVLFEFEGDDLGGEPGVASHHNLYLRDIASKRTYRVNRDDSIQGVFPGEVVAGSASMSADGRQVVFLAQRTGTRAVSTAYRWSMDGPSLRLIGPPENQGGTEQVGIDAGGTRVSYVATDSTGRSGAWWVSLSGGPEVLVTRGPDSGRGVRRAVLSGDGNTLVLQCDYDPLTQATAPQPSGLYAWQIDAGRMVRVSVADSGSTSTTPADSFRVSQDGTRIVFRSRGSDLAEGDENQVSDLFLRDLVRGTTQLLSRSPTTGRSGNNASFHPRISADGGTVAFVSFADDLTERDFNGQPDVFIATISRDIHLEISRAAVTNAVTLRWSVPTGVTARLERRRHLAGAGSWLPVGVPAVDGGSEGQLETPEGTRFERVLPIDSQEAYYRVLSP